MKKKIFSAAIVCAFIGVLCVHCQSRTISSNEATEILEGYLTCSGKMEYETGEELELEFTPPIHEYSLSDSPALIFCGFQIRFFKNSPTFFAKNT